MLRKLISAASVLALSTSPVLASEFGMTSSLGYSYRNGTGSSATFFQSNTQIGETNYFGSTRTNTPSPTESEVGQSSGYRTITETTLTTGRLEENFTFGNTSRNTFTGVFTR